MQKISNDTETRSEHERTLRILEELRRPDVARPMIDEANRDRLDQLLDKYPAEKKVIKTHQSGHDQHHLETTNRRDFVNFNPQFGGQKSLKAVGLRFSTSFCVFICAFDGFILFE